MITAPEYSSDADTISPAPPAGRLAAVEQPPVLVPPRKVWWVSDLVLIALVGFLAVAAIVTSVSTYRHTRTLDQFAKELTTASAAFQAYMKDNGAAPANSDAGVVPPGMERYLGAFNWSAPTSIGGSFRWVNRASGESPEAAAPVTGSIAITAFAPSTTLSLSLADLQEIDRRIDDGNLATGKFRTGFNGWPLLTVRAAP